MVATAPGCELDVERGPDWVLVRVANLDAAEAETPPLAERVWRILQQHFTYRLVLELDEVRLLTSRLIAQLVQLHRRIGEHGGLLRVCGLSEENCEALRACRLYDRLVVCDDRKAAVMGRERPRQPR
jgi:anti-anti-sigma regulatory factor